MFIGEYHVQVGEKNRIAIPKKLRDGLFGNVYITRGYERCILMLDQRRWDNFMKEVNKKPLLSLGVRDTKRFIVGGAHTIEFDSQGRFVVPESLKMFGHLSDIVTFLGVGEWIEIWNTDTWQSRLENLGEQVSDIAERLSE